MWPFKKKIKQRRLEVRKSIRSTDPGWWQRFAEASGVVPLSLAVVFYIGMAMLDMWPIDPMIYRRGQFIPADIYARVEFKTYPLRLLEEKRSEVERTTPAVFSLDGDLLDQITTTLLSAPLQLPPPDEPTEQWRELSEAFALGDEDDRQHWAGRTEGDAREAYEQQVSALADRLARLCSMNRDELTPQLARTLRVYVDFPDGRQTVPSGPRLVVIPPKTDDATLKDRLATITEDVDEPIRENVQAYLLSVLSAAPVYLFDEAATQVEIDKAIQEIEAFPPHKPYNRGQKLVMRSAAQADGGPPRGLSAEDVGVLRAEHQAYGAAERPWRRLSRFVGRGALLAALTVLLAIYVHHYRRRIVTNPWRALALVAVLLLMLGVNKMMFHAGWNPYTAVLPVMMTAVILTIAYDQRFALAVSIIMATCVVLQMRASFATFLTIASAAGCSTLMLREIRTRSKLIEVAGISAAVVFVTTCEFGMTAGTPWRFVITDAVYASGFALLVGFIVQGILPIIERMFNIATSMTLLEWCDASKPLLKRLAMTAPGTYNHSLQLGTMCGAAAENVDARGLLARVGAYYHDIGKINKPEYFVENEAQSASRHARLSPEMSLLIIIGHVKDGVEMAREYGLPNVLHEFISAHHGTTVVQYFYHAATQQRKNGQDRLPDETEFRYPGPKPRSKEAAILMLADAAESSVRSMPDPTPTRIENQVHKMVTARLADGQLDDCDLTLHQVHLIEESLVKSLYGFYHARIAYPKPVDAAGDKPGDADKPVEDAPDRPVDTAADRAGPPAGESDRG